MPRKSRLFASVALPFVSLSLMLQPAHAMTIRPAVDASQTSDVIKVQGAPAADAETPEELKKKKTAGEAEPAEKPKSEAPAEKPRGEAPAEKPARAPRPAAAEENPEAPAGRPARTEKPAAAEEKPEAPAPKPAASDEKPEAPARKPASAEQPAEKPEAPTRKPAAEAAPASEPAARAPASEAQPAVPAPAATPVPKTSPVEEPVAKPPVPKASPIEEPAAKPPVPAKQPDAAPGRQPADGAEKPAGVAPGAAPAAGEPPATPGRQRPPRPAASGEQRPAGAPETAPGQPGSVPPAAGQAPVEPGQPPAAGQAPAPGQPAAPGQPLPDASGGQGAQVAPPPMTPAQLDQAKKIADNPKASTETVILPVQNGAAVLDSDKDAARPGGAPGSREDRRRERADAPVVAAPKSDADAQMAPGGKRQPPVKMEAVTAEQGQRLDRRPDFQQQPGMIEQRRDDNRIIVQIDNQNVIRNDDSDRFTREGEKQYYERLPGGRTRETISRPDRSQVVTIRNRYGDLVQRSRIDPRGREYVLFYAPELMDEPDRDYEYRDPGEDLPPMRLNIPVRDYIIDTTSDPDRDYYKFLEQPPVEPVERVYSLDEVKYSARIRDKVRRIDLDTITFPTGSAEISMNQAASLRKVADAINKVLKNNPAETFLIEGHTDAVGSDESNLVLSDKRAESVANVLSDAFAIPPENLATQGYGERYLKVNTAGPEQQNRRVTIRRVTALVRPVAQN